MPAESRSVPFASGRLSFRLLAKLLIKHVSLQNPHEEGHAITSSSPKVAPAHTKLHSRVCKNKEASDRKRTTNQEHVGIIGKTGERIGYNIKIYSVGCGSDAEEQEASKIHFEMLS